MALWYILAFLYFIVVDALIFMQKWDWLVIALIAGVVFVLILLVTKAVVGQPSEPAPDQTPPQSQPQPQPQTVYPTQDAHQTAIQDPPPQEKKIGAFSIALAFFYGELVIIIGLVLYLFLKG
jgi:hypothetical protein